MGIRSRSPSTFTPITPTSKDVRTAVFQVARTDTSNPLKYLLPGDASIVQIVRQAGTASDAGTTATVVITVTNNSGTVTSGTDDVKTDGAVTGFVSMSSLPNLEPVPLTGDLKINADYAESGTASTTGGPWTYIVQFVR